ncbi:vWA domain-containing protein [Terriglobus aquaticus]|uniref:VWA domain-containing protein n=1 Tax=Terriglobus aquaticus TaxID=940139 RepID=A0ABW9KL52_9BACT|nr:VWA domain-containing protein [Terriglobus aquaticus]
MKRTRYTKYNGDLASELALDDLMQALSDFLLDSGFQDPFSQFQELNGEHTLENLREALRQVLESGEFMNEDEQARFDEMDADQREQMLSDLIDRMQAENFISSDQQQPGQYSDGKVDHANSPGDIAQPAPPQGDARFNVTDKSMDFLGYRTLRDLLGANGRAIAGRHETRYEASGVESSGSSKPYEFGDVLNLDVNATLSNAMQREGIGLPLNVEYSDLEIRQSEYQSACSTVVMLDCSHSMILYGEDRFTPAKRVAMALSHLIRTQYPGDDLHLVLFHDSAEEMPVQQVARVKVGPWYTNTREGLRVAQRILRRSNKAMKQIVMITDGKPSALTMPDGRIYKNAFGLDPIVIAETLEEVNRCKRAGIVINTFMLAQDFALMQFVQRVTAMCRGKAYFTSPERLGSYVLMDFMQRRMKTIQ